MLIFQPNQGGGRRRTTFITEDFNFTGGLDTETPDLTMKAGRVPYVRNGRAYASNDINTRSPVSTRKGAAFYSIPAGETLDVAQTSVTGAADQIVSLTTYQAAKAVMASTGRLTKVELNLKNVTSGTGYLIVEFWSDSAGTPLAKLAQSSIPAASITGSYGYIAARFVEAPQVVSGTTYWIIAYIQSDGKNSYNWSSTTTVTTALTSTNSGVTFTSTSYGLDFKTYVSTDSKVLGLTRYYRSTASPVTVMAHGTSLYSVNDNTGALTVIKTGLNAGATDYYFESANNILYYVNGKDSPRQWDGTTDQVISGVPVTASFIKLHKSHMFFVDTLDPSKMVFSEQADFNTYLSTNLIYFPTTKSTDPIKAVEVLQDNLVVLTRRTKYILYGSDLSSFVMRRSTGLAGTVSANTVKTFENHMFFLSDDGVYEFNGTTDRLISQRPDGSGVTREINNIADKSKCVAEIWNKQYRLYYPSSGSGVNNRCLVYEISKDSWWIDDNVYVGRTTIEGRDADTNKLLEASGLVGAAYYAEQDYNDLGRSIDFELRLPYSAFGNPAATKQLRKYRPQLRAQSGNYQVDCQVDKDYANSPVSNLATVQGTGVTFGSGVLFGSGAVFGSSALIQPHFAPPGLAKYFQFRYKRFGVNMPIEFLGYELEYKRQRTR